MANLITATEFATYRNISVKRDDTKIDECISQAQQTDLLRVLGGFYFDVVANAEDASWADLMDGSTFTYCDNSYNHQGIKKLLADYAHARYVYMRNINDTAFGYVTKEYQDGTPVERNTLRDLAKQDQQDAAAKFEIIEKYILSDTDTFSRYSEEKGNIGQSFNSQKFSIL